MSVLVDKLIKEHYVTNTEQLKDFNWYISKPLGINSIKKLSYRIKDAIRIIQGKSFAVHYKSDE